MSSDLEPLRKGDRVRLLGMSGIRDWAFVVAEGTNDQGHVGLETRLSFVRDPLLLPAALLAKTDRQPWWEER